jgi:hypothetical protein
LNQFFFVLNVTIAFSHHVVTPLDASIIIIVEREGTSALVMGYPKDDREEIMFLVFNHQTTSNICCSDFCFAGA